MTELLYIVSEDDKVIGARDRKMVHSSELWHRGVHVLLYRSDGMILLQMRSKTKDKFPSHYDLSVSEHVAYGEEYEQAAIRGLKEELGIEIPIQEIAYLKMCYGPQDNMVTKVYRAVYDDIIHANSDETEGLEYIQEDQLKEMLGDDTQFAPWTREILKFSLGLEHGLELLSKP